MTHADSHNIFEIPEDKFFKILHEEIIPDLVKNVTAQKEKATAIIIGGQPGSGKTTFQQKALEQLQGNAVICDIDALRDFHPKIKLLKKEYPGDYNKHTYTYAHRWNAEVIKYCLHNKMNFILETTFSDGEWLNKVIDEIEGYPGDVKYHVRVKILAVNPQESLLGIKLRYETQKLRSEEDFGRNVPTKVHDEKFYKIPDALDILVRKKKCITIDICWRSVEEINGKFVSRAEEVTLTSNEDAVTQYCQRAYAPITGNKLKVHKQFLSDLYTILTNQNATPEKIAEVFKIYDPDNILQPEEKNDTFTKK